MKTSKKVITIITILIVVLATAYKLNDVKRDKNRETNLVKTAKLDVPVTIVTVSYSNPIQEIVYNGTFEPLCEVSVVAEAQGKVKSLSVDDGAFVDEGKVIAWLENDIAGYQVETAEAAYDKAKDELKRFESLSPGESVSTQQLAEVRLAFENAKGSYYILKKQYENTFIRAPVSGTVSKRYVEKGSFIACGSPVVDLIDTRKMKFNAWFNARDLLRIKKGQRIKITTDLHRGIIYDAVIKNIIIKPDESKRYRVQAEVLNNKENPLIAGIDGTMHIKIDQNYKSMILPRNCLVGSTLDPHVYVVEKDIAKVRKVVVSEIINGQAIITDGLKEGEKVVLSGQINIEENTKVCVLSINQ